MDLYHTARVRARWKPGVTILPHDRGHVMPSTYFVPCVTFEWPAPSAPALKPPTPTKGKPGPKGPRKSKRKRAEGRLSPQMRATIDDRLEAALCDGRIELLDEEMPCDGLDLTLNELEFLVRILRPDEPEAAAELRERLKKRMTR